MKEAQPIAEDLTGIELDYEVAKAAGLEDVRIRCIGEDVRDLISDIEKPPYEPEYRLDRGAEIARVRAERAKKKEDEKMGEYYLTKHNRQFDPESEYHKTRGILVEVDWSFIGPIVDHEGIMWSFSEQVNKVAAYCLNDAPDMVFGLGDTPLEAIKRCLVKRSKR